MTPMPPATLRPGRRIRIPWGLDEVEAMVSDVVVQHGRRYVVLLIELKGDPRIPDETLEWTFPEESLLAVAES